MMLSTLVGRLCSPYLTPIRNVIIELRQTVETLKVTSLNQATVNISDTDWSPDVSITHNINAYTSHDVKIYPPISDCRVVQGHVTICLRNTSSDLITVTFGAGVSCNKPYVVIPPLQAALLRCFCTVHGGITTGTFITADEGFTPDSVSAPL